MFSITRKIVSVFIALVFLFASFGFTIGKMVCGMSGKTSYSLGLMTDCCKKTNNANKTVLKTKCCHIVNTSISVKDYSPSKTVSFNQVDFVFSFIFPIKNYSLSSISAPNLFAISDIPPPLSGKQIRTLISVFNI